VSNELIPALIASGTAVLVAVISFVVSIVSNRQSARSGKEIEKLKHDFSRASALEALNDSQLGESLKALQLAIKSIQRVKDEIQVVLSAVETPTERQPLMKGIRSAREQMFACYEEQMATLDNDDARTVHSAKNASLQVEALIKRSVPANAETVTLPDELREQLLILRMNLTDLQQILRDSRADKIMKRLEGGSSTENPKMLKSEVIKGKEAVKISTPDSLEGLRLLIVDDNDSTPQLLSLVMTRYGADIRVAHSAVEALDLIIRWKPQVLVSDIMMPDEDGCWLIKQVRSLEAELSKITAIAITGGYDAKERERVLSSGFNACFPKPMLPEDLIGFIRNNIEKVKK
jgi:two-component system, OmpR family, response regulator